MEFKDVEELKKFVVSIGQSFGESDIRQSEIDHLRIKMREEVRPVVVTEMQEELQRLIDEKNEFDTMTVDAVRRALIGIKQLREKNNESTEGRRNNTIEEFNNRLKEVNERITRLQSRRERIQLETSRERDARIAEERDVIERAINRLNVQRERGQISTETYNRRADEHRAQLRRLIFDKDYEISGINDKIRTLEAERTRIQDEYAQTLNNLNFNERTELRIQSIEQDVLRYADLLGVNVRDVLNRTEQGDQNQDDNRETEQNNQNQDDNRETKQSNQNQDGNRETEKNNQNKDDNRGTEQGNQNKDGNRGTEQGTQNKDGNRETEQSNQNQDENKKNGEEKSKSEQRDSHQTTGTQLNNIGRDSQIINELMAKAREMRQFIRENRDNPYMETTVMQMYNELGLLESEIEKLRNSAREDNNKQSRNNSNDFSRTSSDKTNENNTTEDKKKTDGEDKDATAKTVEQVRNDLIQKISKYEDANGDFIKNVINLIKSTEDIQLIRVIETRVIESLERTTIIRQGKSAETPVKENSAQTDPAKKTPVKENSAQTDPAKETPVKDNSTQTDPAKETPVKDNPVQTDPAKETPVKDNPAQTDPTGPLQAPFRYNRPPVEAGDKIHIDAQKGIVTYEKISIDESGNARRWANHLKLDDIMRTRKQVSQIRDDCIDLLVDSGLSDYAFKVNKRANPAILKILMDSGEVETLAEYLDCVNDKDRTVRNLPFKYSVRLGNAVQDKTLGNLNKAFLNDNKYLGTRFSAVSFLGLKRVISRIIPSVAEKNNWFLPRGKVKALDEITGDERALNEAMHEYEYQLKSQERQKARDEEVTRNTGGRTTSQAYKDFVQSQRVAPNASILYPNEPKVNDAGEDKDEDKDFEQF